MQMIVATLASSALVDAAVVERSELQLRCNLKRRTKPVCPAFVAGPKKIAVSALP
jgi:hypothetical protein